mmetsp:Transcript_110217/g.298957  ORF Transcript_110217/g.298957 Transcript_110217/m.298957 type:complete len:239 (-) Transcript_110217:1683-2399(-)
MAPFVPISAPGGAQALGRRGAGGRGQGFSPWGGATPRARGGLRGSRTPQGDDRRARATWGWSGAGVGLEGRGARGKPKAGGRRGRGRASPGLRHGARLRDVPLLVVGQGVVLAVARPDDEAGSFGGALLQRLGVQAHVRVRCPLDLSRASSWDDPLLIWTILHAAAHNHARAVRVLGTLDCQALAVLLGRGYRASACRDHPVLLRPALLADVRGRGGLLRATFVLIQCAALVRVGHPL